jgi:DNA-binding response OmpR family regulator
LLVEDNDAASRGLERILESQGYEVTVVFDGVSALGILNGQPPPDFLLTDLRLPDLDGREVAVVARQLVPRPRVALITGWDLESAQQEPASWGIDWVFPKPLDVHHLIATLRQSSEQAAGPQPQTDGRGTALP